MDDWDYLERQVDPAAAPAPRAPSAEPAKEERSRGNGADVRSSKSPSRERERSERRRGSRSPSRERDSRKRGSRSRSRDRRRDRDRDREERDRRRSPDARRDRRDDRDYRRDDRRDDRSMRRRDDGPHDRRRERERTPPEVRAAREAEKELREMERSTRTAFAYNLSLKADERDIYQVFAKVGKVVDIKLITDKTTRRSKGFAYIEFAKVEDVIAAVALTGSPGPHGVPLMVKGSEHEKNLAWEAQQQAKQSQLKAAALLGAAGGDGAGGGAGPCRLYVGNLNAAIAEADLQALFAPFGAVDNVQVVRDGGGKSQGYGYISFASTLHATQAMEHWNGRVLAGTALKVSVATLAAPGGPALPGALPGALAAAALPGGLAGLASPAAAAGALALPPGLSLTPEVAARLGLTLPAAAVPGLPGVVVPAVPAGAVPEAVYNSGIGELDEEEARGGLKLTSDRRQALMARLASSAGLPGPPPAAVPATIVAPGAAAAAAAAAAPKPVLDPALGLIQSLLGPASPIPTPCLLIKNMFDPASAEAEMGPGWGEEIEGDVREECGKYGPVLHVHVDKASKGCVYLKFGSVEGAAAAQHAMNGRWFAGRQLGVEFQFAAPYASHFKC